MLEWQIATGATYARVADGSWMLLQVQRIAAHVVKRVIVDFPTWAAEIATILNSGCRC